MNNRIIYWGFLITAPFLAPGISRARWMNPDTGRFHTMDSYEGHQENPISLQKYLYAHANPVNLKDPSGLEVAVYSHQVDAVGIVWPWWSHANLSVVPRQHKQYSCFSPGGRGPACAWMAGGS